MRGEELRAVHAECIEENKLESNSGATHGKPTAHKTTTKYASNKYVYVNNIMLCSLLWHYLNSQMYMKCMYVLP